MSDKSNAFPDTKFKNFEFKRADMTTTNFNGVDLSDSKFWAVIERAQFTDSNLAACKFDDVNLSGSTYENVNLSNSTFNNINFSNVSLSNLNLSNTEITDANLDGMKINGVLVTEMLDIYEKNS